jgi:hypothetical protein
LLKRALPLLSAGTRRCKGRHRAFAAGLRVRQQRRTHSAAKTLHHSPQCMAYENPYVVNILYMDCACSAFGHVEGTRGSKRRSDTGEQAKAGIYINLHVHLIQILNIQSLVYKLAIENKHIHAFQHTVARFFRPPNLIQPQRCSKSNI